MSRLSTWAAGAPSLHEVLEDAANDRSAARIALVSDDEPLRLLLQELLAAHGYDVVAAGSRYVSDSPRSLNGAAVAILDTTIHHPGVTRAHRALQAGGASIVTISAGTDRPSERGELAAADEVRLRKPFDPRALLLIVRGLLIDADAAHDSRSTICAGPVGLSTPLNTAFVASREIELTDAETRILHELLLNAGSPVARERLTRRALLRDWSPEDRSLDAHINRLRRKLGNDRRGHTPIRTVRGFGYRLLAEWEPV